MKTAVVRVFSTLMLLVASNAQVADQQSVRQTTTGRCSPAVVAGGNVTITCSGLEEGQIESLKELSRRIDELLQQRADISALLSKLDHLDDKQDAIFEAVIAIKRDVAQLNGLKLPPYIAELKTFGDKVLPVSVGQSRGATLSPLEVDRILAIASVFLSPCDIRLERVGIIGRVDPDELMSASEWDRLKSNPFDVQVVRRIGYCDRPMPGPGLMLGCAEVNGAHLVLAGSAESEGLIGLGLAHELGHLAGLPHKVPRERNGMSLMDAALDDAATKLERFPEVSPSECQSLAALAARLRKLHGSVPR